MEDYMKPWTWTDSLDKRPKQKEIRYDIWYLEQPK
jgi:hypothetical protein